MKLHRHVDITDGLILPALESEYKWIIFEETSFDLKDHTFVTLVRVIPIIARRFFKKPFNVVVEETLIREDLGYSDKLSSVDIIEAAQDIYGQVFSDGTSA